MLCQFSHLHLCATQQSCQCMRN
uniref:Uncharacterized protein n=1 Tax=Anguilla anguilla TaxID=7936 RepID=A0A0E9XNZ9_ANGAN